MKNIDTLHEIILHVGLPKTGTTSIQETLFLHDNNIFLIEQGYLYPECWPVNHSLAIYSAFCDHPDKYELNIYQGLNQDEIKVANKNYLDTLVSWTKEIPHKKLIISGEDISSLTDNNLFLLRQYLESLYTPKPIIKVFLYVRNPVDWAESGIQELMKYNRTKQDAINYYKNILNNHLSSTLDKLINIFGREYVKITSFEKAITHNHGIVGHFLMSIGFNKNHLSNIKYIKSNERISQIALDIIVYINENSTFLKDGYLHRTGSFVYFFGIKGKKYSLADDERRLFYDISKDDAQWLFDNHGIDYTSTKTDYKEFEEPEEYITQKTALDIKKMYVTLPIHIMVILKKFIRILFSEHLSRETRDLLICLLEDLNTFDSFLVVTNLLNENITDQIVTNTEKAYLNINSELRLMVLEYVHNKLKIELTGASNKNKHLLTSLLQNLVLSLDKI